MYPQHAAALSGLEGFSHALILTWLDRVSNEERTRQRAPVGPDGWMVGVLALRTQHRPNPIGLTLVEVHAIHGALVEVVGMDGIDGTPVLDIKPYIPLYDSRPQATLPAWAIGNGGR